MTGAEDRTDDEQEDQDEQEKQEDKGPQFYHAPQEAHDLLAGLRVEHHHPRLDSLRIRLVFTKGKLKESGEDVPTRTQKASPIVKDLTAVDVWIIMREEFWQKHVDGEVPQDDVLRALDHELCAMDWDGKGGVLRFKRMPGEYLEVVQRWGIDGLAELGDALRSYQTRMELDG